MKTRNPSYNLNWIEFFVILVQIYSIKYKHNIYQNQDIW